jgi:type III pantothenate kinase
MDRIAAAVGAYSILPQRDILIIDAGTAITYDIVTKDGEYIGGNISAGIDLRFKALNEFTAKLPLVKSDGVKPFIGNNTETAIRCGILDGVKHEIEGFINQFTAKYPHLLVFLTGGTDFDFDERVKKRIFADKFLVLRGLNRILQEQAL